MRLLRISGFFLAVVLLCAVSDATTTDRPWQPETTPQAIDVAIAVDTSGSMMPFIDAARLRLWQIVEEMKLLEPAPPLRVALLSYGRENSKAAGAVQLETGLTTDLAQVSDHLFGLEGAGGAQYAASALQVAFEGLTWTDSEGALRLIFIAGTEPAGEPQGSPVDFRETSAVARREEVFVDDIDTELAELSAAINETFLPLGELGAKRQQSALEQDRSAEQLSLAVAASRALVKAGPLYSAGWDLVDALAAGDADLYELEYSEHLPEDLREMNVAELEQYVEKLREDREELRRRILELGDERRRRVAGQMKSGETEEQPTFNSAERDTLRERLAEQGFVVVELMSPDFEPSVVSTSDQ